MAVRVTDTGTVWVFQIKTEDARTWVAANVDVPAWAWLGTTAFAVDWRMAGPLVDGMRDNGLDVQAGS
jgi:hypothetical protein